MSGGSYDYLYRTKHDPFTISEKYERVHQMAGRLIELGNLPAAQRTLDILEIAKGARKLIGSAIREIADLWQAVEMHDSGDWSDEQLRKALENYAVKRGCNKPSEDSTA